MSIIMDTDDYNDKRLHRAVGDVTLRDSLEGKDANIHKTRAEKMSLTRVRREKIGAIGKKDGQEACNLDETS